MDKVKKFFRVYPRLIVRQLRRVVVALGARKPSQRFILAALSGKAVMVWTVSGNIVITPDSARKLGNRLLRFADIAEGNQNAPR